jgi:hypothetical protein
MMPTTRFVIEIDHNVQPSPGEELVNRAELMIWAMEQVRQADDTELEVTGVRVTKTTTEERDA